MLTLDLSVKVVVLSYLFISKATERILRTISPPITRDSPRCFLLFFTFFSHPSLWVMHTHDQVHPVPWPWLQGMCLQVQGETGREPVERTWPSLPFPTVADFKPNKCKTINRALLHDSRIPYAYYESKRA